MTSNVSGVSAARANLFLSLLPMVAIMRSQLGADELGQSLGGVGLRPLDRGTDGTVDDELGQHTNGTRDTEEDGVEALLGQAVVLEQDTGVGVNVGVGVLGLAVLGQDTGATL